MPACRKAAVRRPHSEENQSPADAGMAVTSRTKLCGYRTCSTLILSLPGTTPTNRCTEHRGVANEPETDESLIARVCREFGWRRVKR
jgi:hypothetical protein